MQLYSLGGLLAGMLVGTVLAIWAAKKNQKDLAVIGFSCCVFFGSIGGLILIIPVVAIFLWLIWKANNKSKQVSVNGPDKTGDDKFYDEVARELQGKSIVAGLWTKAFAEMDGDDAKARALYIRYRVQQLATEAALQQEMAARQHESAEQKREREIALIRNRFSYLRNLKYGDDEQIPNSQFDGIPGTLSHPVNSSIVADALGVPDAAIIIAIRSGNVTGVRCDGEWFVDLGIV
jgi:hypothetical protein